VLLTLVDQETPFWLDPDAAAARDWIAFHCGAPAVPDPAHASFALALGLPDLSRFPAGTHEAPETSATVIVQLPALTGGRALRLRGPGLEDSAILAPAGLPADFVRSWRRNRALFPGGVDFILCAGDTLAALPRTVSIEEA
jgi:alpha-D-ribose 1-methylphosphonate 5-triphosphate synthase subunit PhnH